MSKNSKMLFCKCVVLSPNRKSTLQHKQKKYNEKIHYNYLGKRARALGRERPSCCPPGPVSRLCWCARPRWPGQSQSSSIDCLWGINKKQRGRVWGTQLEKSVRYGNVCTKVNDNGYKKILYITDKRAKTKGNYSKYALNSKHTT